jgi:GMP synthase PP-ATPase subunit
MEAIHKAMRLNYTCISQIIQAEMNFLSELSDLTDDQRFRQSIAEVINSLDDLSDTVNRQRRYLNPRFDAE